jgi:putative transposase
MTNYRRDFVPGGSYFFTVDLFDRRKRLLVEHVAALRAAFNYARTRHPFDIAAVVVLPDHLHAIWIPPEGDADYALRWRLIKSEFSRSLPGGERLSTSRVQKGERATWQRRPVLSATEMAVFDQVEMNVIDVAFESFSSRRVCSQ